MMAARRLMFIALAMASVGPTTVEARTLVVINPLAQARPPVAALFGPGEQHIAVTVRDERADRDFLATGFLGLKGEEAKGQYLGFATQTEGELPDFIKGAAEDALEVLGMQAGDDLRLEIVLRDLRVDTYWLSGFSPINCMAYGHVDATLSSAAGTQLLSKSFKLRYYENTTRMDTKVVSAHEALSWIFTKVAWQVTTRTLIEHLQLTPDPERLGRAVRELDATKETEVTARQTIFWLGLAGSAETVVKDELLSLFRTSGKQRVHQAAVEAIGMLGITEAREDIEALLAGTKELGGWDATDGEHVWYLLNTLAMLGCQNLSEKIPKGEIEFPSQLRNLIRFLESGGFRELSAAEVARLDEARAKLLKKRR